MLKLNREIDYGIVILCHLIRSEAGGKPISSAKEIAAANQVSQPMVSKILKLPICPSKTSWSKKLSYINSILSIFFVNIGYESF